MENRNAIKSVKFYQGVQVGKSSLGSFQPDDQLSDAALRSGKSAEITENGVLIRDAEMNVLVPWNNVAYIQMIETKKAEKPAKASKA
jgi:hypothetical protein